MGIGTDAFGGDLPLDGPGYLRTARRALILDQLVAIPIALVMTSVGVPFVYSLVVASIYSHSIGGVCTAASVVALSRLDRFAPARGLAALMGVYFAAGAVGAEIARRVCEWIFGVSFHEGPAYLSWAIGATMAVLVGTTMLTIRRLRARAVSTELEALQARINPHFLFNTLNSIAALIREDPSRAEAMTLQLSSLFRYTLTASRRGLVTLEEELTIVEGYLAVEQERLGPRLSYSIEVDPGIRKCRLPPLTLQPLVENAIKHGVATTSAGGMLRVRGWREGDRVHVAVGDPGRGEAVEGGTGEGLDNVRRRLRATFGTDSSVSLVTEAGATEARLTFPAVEAPA